MPSKESLAKTKSLCSCTGFPEGEHGPRCPAGKAADLLDEAIRVERDACKQDIQDAIGDWGGPQRQHYSEALQRSCEAIDKRAQLREGKT